MNKPSHLLEHLSRKILNTVCKNFPSIVFAEVKVSKINPALGGKMKCVSVSLEYNKE
jgi:dihydroneopterin aldolase